MSIISFEHYFPTRVIFEKEKSLDLRPYLQPEGNTLLIISKSLHQREPEIAKSLPKNTSVYAEIGSNPTLQHLKK